MSSIGTTCPPSLLEMFVIGRVMGRCRERESRMIAAMPAGRKRLALYDCYLMLVLMDAVMNNVVNSRSGALVARFELFHSRYARAGDCPSAVWVAALTTSPTFRRGGVASNNSSDPAKHNPAME